MKIMAIDPGNIDSAYVVLTEEEWIDVKGYEGEYMVSDLGRVKSIGRIVVHECFYGESKMPIPTKILSPVIDSYGYEIISLCHQGERKSSKVHRLVAEAFIQKVDGKEQVNHKDGDKKNNNVSNLEWCDGSENKMHAFRTGLQVAPKGKDSASSKAVEMIKDGVAVMQFGSMGEACRYLNLKLNRKSDISRCCRGKGTRAAGYEWRFVK